jgi:hypothetical protein
VKLNHLLIFRNEGLFFEPSQVVRDLIELGVGRFVVSSVSTKHYGHEQAKSELQTITNLSSCEVAPLCWVLPTDAVIPESLDLLLENRAYRGIKIHGFDDWYVHIQSLENVFIVAKERMLPIFLHTGGHPTCDAEAYLTIIKKYPEVKAILYHSRPAGQTAMVLRACENAWAEVSFMPLADVKKLLDEFGNQRVVFGSDHPIQKHFFPNVPVADLYGERVHLLRSILDSITFEEWTQNAWQAIFGDNTPPTSQRGSCVLTNHLHENAI